MDYTFNGHGEYWLIRSKNCNAQVRTVPWAGNEEATVIKVRSLLVTALLHVMVWYNANVMMV